MVQVITLIEDNQIDFLESSESVAVNEFIKWSRIKMRHIHIGDSIGLMWEFVTHIS